MRNRIRAFLFDYGIYVLIFLSFIGLLAAFAFNVYLRDRAQTRIAADCVAKGGMLLRSQDGIVLCVKSESPIIVVN